MASGSSPTVPLAAAGSTGSFPGIPCCGACRPGWAGAPTRSRSPGSWPRGPPCSRFRAHEPSSMRATRRGPPTSSCRRTTSTRLTKRSSTEADPARPPLDSPYVHRSPPPHPDRPRRGGGRRQRPPDRRSGDDQHRHGRRRGDGPPGRGFAKIGFAEDNYRTRVTFESRNQIAFEPSKVEVVIETLNDKNCVDVCGDNLFFAV